jgi:hypothetical protein
MWDGVGWALPTTAHQRSGTIHHFFRSPASPTTPRQPARRNAAWCSDTGERWWAVPTLLLRPSINVRLRQSGARLTSDQEPFTSSSAHPCFPPRLANWREEMPSGARTLVSAGGQCPLYCSDHRSMSGCVRAEQGSPAIRNHSPFLPLTRVSHHASPTCEKKCRLVLGHW